MTTNSPSLFDQLNAISCEDVAGLVKAQESYGDSWKKRGGVGAFMMLARKWDRMENRVRESASYKVQTDVDEFNKVPVSPYDIFEHIVADTRAEGLIDDIRDLRRYLMLVEAEMRARGATAAVTTHRDNV